MFIDSIEIFHMQLNRKALCTVLKGDKNDNKMYRQFTPGYWYLTYLACVGSNNVGVWVTWATQHGAKMGLGSDICICHKKHKAICMILKQHIHQCSKYMYGF